MKKLMMAVLFGTALVSCKKEGGNTGVVKANETPATVRYVAEDGSNALVSYTTSEGAEFISINSNNHTIRVKEAGEENGNKLYSENGVDVVVKEDSLIITQTNAVIGLKKAGEAK